MFPNNSVSRHAIGVFYVLLVVLLWVSSSELTQSIFEDSNFNHPFFLTYFSTALFMIYCPFFIRLSVNECKSYLNGNNIDPSLYTSLTPKQSPSRSAAYSSVSPNQTDQCIRNDSRNIQCVEYVDDPSISTSDEDEQTDSYHIHNDNDIDINTSSNTCKCTFTYDSICIPSLTKLNKLSFKDTFKLSLIFCPIWFLMNYTFNVSLNMTSVASNTILSTLSGPFSLLLSKGLLKTKLSFCNLSGVMVTLIGAVFIGYLDDTESANDGNGTMVGDALAVVSAFIYGIYVTLIKYKIKDESSVNMFLFFGALGFINIVMLWPFLIILDVIKYEMFVWPSNDILCLLTLNGIISVGSDYFWAQSILYTSPVVATVGLSLMMPVAMLADEVFKNERHSAVYWSGAIFVMMGFILVNLDFKHQREEKPEETLDKSPQLHMQIS